MRIGVDIDDTITNSWEYFIPYYAKLFNIDEKLLSKSMPYYKAIEDYISLDDYYKIVFPIHEKYTSVLPLKENVKDVIDKLYALGHTIYFITARGSYTNIKDKADICQKEKIDLYIDDSVKHCTSVKEKGIEVLMFDTYYNKEFKEFTHVHSWNEIYEYIKDRW